MEELARQVNMAPSTFNRHFKEITSLSPLQFQKRLRLYEAERLMLIEGKDAGTAALSVGYESVSQFTREYKRQFGEPPHRDVARKKIITSYFKYLKSGKPYFFKASRFFILPDSIERNRQKTALNMYSS